MDIFERYLYEELTAQYAESSLSVDDYKELYQRFCSIGHFPEVKPYLLVMRFWGWGTVSERENVLFELKEILNDDDYLLKGLYYDLLLTIDTNDADARKNLYEMINLGYTDRYMKEKSNINATVSLYQEVESQKINNEEELQSDEDVVVERIIFESKGESGVEFTAGDVDYLKAKVFIKPIHGKKHLKVRSQIFLNEETFSKIFLNEYDIDSNTKYFQTSGWGNEKCTCYDSDTYRWVVEIDGKDTFGQSFRMYDGKLNKNGPIINDVKLFASKASGAEKRDMREYKTTFDAKKLEYVYFKFLMDSPEETMNIRVFIQVTSLEDNTVIKKRDTLYQLSTGTTAIWGGVGFSEAGKWKKGLYKYIARCGNAKNFEGVFTVY